MFDLKSIIGVIIVAVIALIPAYIDYKLSENKNFEKSWLISFAILEVIHEIGLIINP